MSNLIYEGPTQFDGEIVTADVVKNPVDLVKGLDRLAVDIHEENVKAGWWSSLDDPPKDLLHERNRGEMVSLCLTELQEASEDKEFDDKLIDRAGFDVELADFTIRLLDLIGAEQRIGGQQPLITFHLTHGHTSVMREQDHVPVTDKIQCLPFIASPILKAFDEGFRKGKHRLARYWLTVTLMRTIAVANEWEIPLFAIMDEKRAFNRKREDHKLENRRKAGGKKC
ncbi:hypothetical protein [Alterisphingorhabdus coralli]|uniref:Uncharacterized protein n=1 Tax=Alterisphingorhabdus coralli TaxID=3071408 RepID=A0AA97FAM2_9SPHN|nr:hypothetical protein [Parasphingorhabdus sp. SCSIO 66989]WOE76342.1 hypothetical protein RB602_06415 [Parasphingorhabdus sp. SCSIO 66989]